MLIDIRPDWQDTRFRDARLDWDKFDEHGLELYELERLARGVYSNLTGVFSLVDVTQGLVKNEHPFDPFFIDAPLKEKFAIIQAQARGHVPEDYGVCDSYEQILTRWPQLESESHLYAIDITRVYHSDQPARDGWRWHKWGTYIGTHKIEHEYLADEVGIDHVDLFQIIEFEPQAAAR